jgi:hypothetical protein
LTIQNHPWGVSSELGWLRSNGLALSWLLDASILAKKSEFAEAEFSTGLIAPKPDWCKTYSSWIPILTTLNHLWGVSSELGWLRSNGLALSGWLDA